jgi:hypothetical protein
MKINTCRMVESERAASMAPASIWPLDLVHLANLAFGIQEDHLVVP